MIATTIVMLGAFPAFFFQPAILPAPGWTAVAGGLAALAAAVTVAIIFTVMVMAVPKRSRTATLPKMGLLMACLFALCTTTYWSLFENTLTYAAARISPRVSVREVTVLSVSTQSEKLCGRPIVIAVNGGSHKLCRSSGRILADLEPGDTLRIAGRDTPFGMTVDAISVARR